MARRSPVHPSSHKSGTETPTAVTPGKPETPRKSQCVKDPESPCPSPRIVKNGNSSTNSTISLPLRRSRRISGVGVETETADEPETNQRQENETRTQCDLSSEDNPPALPEDSGPESEDEDSVDGELERLRVSCPTPATSMSSRKAVSAERLEVRSRTIVLSEERRSSAGEWKHADDFSDLPVNKDNSNCQRTGGEERFSPYSEHKNTDAEISSNILSVLKAPPSEKEMYESQRRGCVYLHQHASLPYIKFGSTKDYCERAKAHKNCDFNPTKNHTKKELVPERRRLESVVQRELSNYRYRFKCYSCRRSPKHDEMFKYKWDEFEAVVDRWQTWFTKAIPTPYDEQGKLDPFWHHRAHIIASRSGNPSEDQTRAGNTPETWADFTKLPVDPSEVDAFDPNECYTCKCYLEGEPPSEYRRKGKSRRSDVSFKSVGESPRSESSPINNAGNIYLNGTKIHARKLVIQGLATPAPAS